MEFRVVTAFPPRRRQQPLNLEGAWLVTESPEGSKEVPGMSVVADARGFTVVGPEPGSERTIPWELTTGFTCQRPARLPDGSPATMLEVGLANGRVLQLMLPVTRVPPSETVVVETELAVMSEQYGGRRPQVAGREATTLDKPQADIGREGSTERLGAPRREPPERVATPAGVGAAVGVGASVGASVGSGPLANGSSANGSSANGLSSLQVAGRSFAPEPSGSSVAVAPVEPAEAPAQGGPPAQGGSPAPAPMQAPGGPADTSVFAGGEPAYSFAPATQPQTQRQPQAQSVAQPQDQPVAQQQKASDGAGDGSTERREARENRMLHMLVALIGVVVVVLIAELVLVLFVLNHSSTNHKSSSGRENSVLVYTPRDTR
jgi:hypothetical protein